MLPSVFIHCKHLLTNATIPAALPLFYSHILFPTMTSNNDLPHLHLTPIVGMLTNTMLKFLTKEIYTNACRGSHGPFGLVMPVTECLLAAGVALQLLAYPGPVPIHDASGANGAT